MFKKLLETANKLGQMKVPVSAKSWADEEGYLDRECPSPECMCSFKVFEEDWWSSKIRDEEVFCPFCRHNADAKQWFTSGQVEHMKQQALAHVSGLINESMREDALTWNRRQSGNRLFSITMKVSSGSREVVLPLAAAQPMRLKIECDQCTCRFAAVGAAFFCPGCGHNAANRVFAQSLNTVRAALEAVTAVRTSLDDADAAENTARTLIESGLQNAVMAFQRFAEALFATQVQPPRTRRNVFQNLAEGSTLWATSFGSPYDAHLSKEEIGKLTQFFQQRHLLAHREGIVDEDYVTRSGDTRYRTGQRIVVREDAVKQCVDLVEKLAAGMSSDANGHPSRHT